MQKSDPKILAVASRDLVAAEAHYHHSCYRMYTNKGGETATTDVSPDAEEDCLYNEAERHANESLYTFIRDDLFTNPRVLKMIDLTAIVVEVMSNTGITMTKESTKKHIRRNIEKEFADTLHFCKDDKGKTLVFPHTLTIYELVKENQKLKDKIETLTAVTSGDSSVVIKAGQIIRSSIKEIRQDQVWPFTPALVNWSGFRLPELLQIFITCVLSGEPSYHSASQKIQLLVDSYGQDLVYSVTCGRVKPPKHILLSNAVKTLTGNSEIIQIMNKLGHGVSYTVLEENDTALSLQKIASSSDDSVPLPDCVNPYIYSALVWDNIDFLEETATGAGTSHRVNGIIVQQKVYGPKLESARPVIEKKKQRSIKYEEQQLPIYNTGKREGPGSKTVAEEYHALPQKSIHRKDLIWILLRQMHPENQIIPGWTGINIIMRQDQTVHQHNIGYLNPINFPATSMATAAEILNRSMKVKESLHLQEVVLVFDQALYSKVAEVLWKHRCQYPGVILRLGSFHMVCNFLGILGKRFEDAGLRDLCIEAGIVAEGSVTSVMAGRQYNRSLRTHKYIYEALFRLLWAGFLLWLKEQQPTQMNQIDQLLELLSDLLDTSRQSSKYEETLNHELFLQMLEHFEKYCEHLRHTNGPLSALWMSYFDMVGGVLLALIRSSREGDWNLHMAAVRGMIVWCFAYDRQNYARYLPVYYAEMSQLRNDHPEVLQHFLEGEFSVQLGEKNPFAKIPLDQTIEETANRDTKVAGGVRKYSLKPGAVSRFFLTAEYRSSFLRHLRDVLVTGKSDHGHVELQNSRIKKDELAVNAVVETLQNWVNPFEENQQELVSLSTAAAATRQIATQLLEAEKRGEAAYQSFKSERLESSPPVVKFHDPLPKLRLKTFSDMTKKQKKVSSNGKEMILKADRKLFGQMVLIAQTRKNLDMKDVLAHPLGPLPWSLACEDGSIRKTNKAVLARALQKDAQAENIPTPSATIIDGMALVQKMKGDQKTFGDIANTLLLSAIREGAHSTRIDIVFDVYQPHSIKHHERARRSKNPGIQFKNITSQQIVRQWRSYLQSSDNKTELIEFLFQEWQQPHSRSLLQSKHMFVTSKEKCIKITDSAVEDVPELCCQQEEADTRVLLHGKHASDTGSAAVIFVADDTDVFLLSMAFCTQITAPLYQKCGTKTRTHYIDITAVVNMNGSDVSEAVIGLHAFTGCDSVSAFAGCGKMKAFKLVKANQNFQSLFKELGQQWSLSSSLQARLERFVCAMYDATSGDASVNEFRYKLFCAKKGEKESYQLPPCADCLGKHARRANYQTAIWRQSLMNDPKTPNPAGYGWKFVGDGDDRHLAVDWMDGAPAPDAVLEMLSCKCRKSCRVPQCPCAANGLKCSDICSLSPCENQPMNDGTDSEMELSSEDDSETEDY